MTRAPATSTTRTSGNEEWRALGPVDLIVALDVPDRTRALQLVRQLGASCDFYKVGLELFSAEGPDIVRWLGEQGKRVFVDLKLHDIPNTVRGAARSVARLGASLLTVHAVGGPAMVRAAVEGAAEGAAGPPCDILGVTVLTSSTDQELADAWGRSAVDLEAEVRRLAGLARSGGARGVVCSGHELDGVRNEFGSSLDMLVPGIRPSGGAVHDQVRVVTAADAAARGARWLVIGRAVTGADDPAQALAAMRDEVSRGLARPQGTRDAAPGSTA